MIEVYYDSEEDLGSIPEKDVNWEGKINYTQKGLVSFPNNRNDIYPLQTQKNTPYIKP